MRSTESMKFNGMFSWTTTHSIRSLLYLIVYWVKQSQNHLSWVSWYIINPSWYYQYLSIEGTYDTQELVYTLNGSELCLNCRFVPHSTVKGCTALILLSSTLYHVILEIPRTDNSAEKCLTLSDNGTYQVSVYDWEKDGVISIKPAVVEKIVVNEVPSTLKSMLLFHI